MCEPVTIAALIGTAATAATASTAAVAGTGILGAIGATSAALAGVGGIAGAASLASTAAGIGGAVMQHNAASSAATANRQAAVKAYGHEQGALTLRQIQEQNASADQRLQQQNEYTRARASAVNAGDAAGIRGLSVDALLNDLAGQQGDRVKANDTNLGMTLQQLQAEKVASGTGLQSRVNSIAKPSNAALALTIGGQALDGYSSYQKATRPQ